MRKLKYTEVPPVRARILAQQGGVCALCGDPPDVPCLDHCHSEGHIRGVLCRGCNALLGKLENNRKRYGLGNLLRFFKFVNNVSTYLTRHKFGELLHPTFKTEAEKKVARAEAARKRRAAKKEQ